MDSTAAAPLVHLEIYAEHKPGIFSGRIPCGAESDDLEVLDAVSAEISEITCPVCRAVLAGDEKT